MLEELVVVSIKSRLPMEWERQENGKANWSMRTCNSLSSNCILLRPRAENRESGSGGNSLATKNIPLLG